MQVVHGIEHLTHDLGPAFIAIGVFDGLHRGHMYLLEHLGKEAVQRGARPAVVTFDHHPDEVLTGHAPPLLLDPIERLDRLASAGVAITVVQHFDAALRETPYDAFVERIRERIELRGFLMTPDAAFGYERRGTPETLAELGARDRFDVVVIPPFTLGEKAVRSSDIRAQIAAGNLIAAEDLLGRQFTLSGVVEDAGPDGVALGFELPMALPPAGEYRCTVGGRPGRLRIDRDVAYLRADVMIGAYVTVELIAPDATVAR
jgi:riboflavin kinase/FMN adenylyltransferase